MALREALGTLAAQAAAMVHTRIELLALEALEVRGALLRQLMLALAAGVCLVLAVLVGTLTVALYFWPTEYRYLALGLLTLGYAVVGGLLAWRVLDLLSNGPAPFATFRAVLAQDAEALRPSHAAGAAGQPVAVSAPVREPATPEEAQ